MGGQLGEGLGKQNDRVGLIVTVTEGLCVMPNLLSVSPPSIQLPYCHLHQHQVLLVAEPSPSPKTVLFYQFGSLL